MNTIVRKIPLDGLITHLVDMYNLGVNYIDISGEPSGLIWKVSWASTISAPRRCHSAAKGMVGERVPRAWRATASPRRWVLGEK